MLIVRDQIMGQSVIMAVPVVQLQQTSLPCPAAASPAMLHDGSCSPHVRPCLDDRVLAQGWWLVYFSWGTVHECFSYHPTPVYTFLPAARLLKSHQNIALVSHSHPLIPVALACDAFFLALESSTDGVGSGSLKSAAQNVVNWLI